jgi:hypothetical protein
VKIQEKIQLGRTQKNPGSFGFGSFQYFGFRFGSGSRFLGSSSGSVLRKNLGSGFGSGSVPSSAYLTFAHNTDDVNSFVPIDFFGHVQKILSCKKPLAINMYINRQHKTFHLAKIRGKIHNLISTVHNKNQ